MFKKLNKAWFALLATFVFLIASPLFAAETQTKSITFVDVSAKFVETSRTVSINYEINNPTKDFINNIDLYASFFKGDLLATSSSVLGNTKFVLAEQGEVARIDPQSKYKGTFDVILPSDVDPGNYFINLQGQNEDGSQGISWTLEQPVFVTGTGGFITLPDANVIYKDQVLNLLQGLQQTPDESLVVAFKKGVEPKFDALADAGKITISGGTVSLQGDSSASTTTSNFVNVPLKKMTVVGIEYYTAEFKPTTSLTPGPYDFRFNVSNGSKQLNFRPITARWLVDGFVPRITQVLTGTNFLKSDKSLDLGVYVYTKNGAGRKGTVKVDLMQNGVAVQSFEQAIDFSIEENAVDFGSSKSNLESDVKIDQIKAVLLDDNGIVLDTGSIDINAEKAYVKTDLKKYLVPGIIALIVLVLLGGIITYRRSRNKKVVGATALLMLSIFVIGAAINSNSAQAVTSMKTTTTNLTIRANMNDFNGAGRTADTYHGPSGNLGACPQTATVVYGAWHSCPHCANGITIGLKIHTYMYPNLETGEPVGGENVETNYGGFPGGMTNNFGSPAFVKYITVTSATPKSAYLVEAESVNYGHGFCLGSNKSSGWNWLHCTPNLTAPTLTAATSAECGGKVLLSWSEVASANRYDVYRSETAGGSYAKIGSTGTLAFEDVVGVYGATRYYKIKAVDTVGNLSSDFSNTVSANSSEECTVVTGNVELSCSGVKSGPDTNPTVTWTASVGGTNVNASDYSFNWTGDVTGTGQSITKAYTTGGTKSSDIRATLISDGTKTYTASCSVNSIICTPGQKFCPDQNKCINENEDCGGCTTTEKYCQTLHQCIPKDNDCTVCSTGQKYCHTLNKCINNAANCGGGVVYCPSLDQYIPEGTPCPGACGTLDDSIVAENARITPATPGLCSTGFKLLPDSLFGSVAGTSWKWVCTSATTGKGRTSCDANCAVGTTYCPTSNRCSTKCDTCPLDYTVSETGECVPPTGKIIYFRANPDTATTSCPAFWSTEVSAGAHMDCSINTNPVSANKLTGGSGYDVAAGAVHTLSCGVRTNTDNDLVKTVTATTRCFRLGTVIEQ